MLYIGIDLGTSAVKWMLMDINNSVPARMWEEQIKGKYNYSLTDPFMGFHYSRRGAAR